MLQRQTDLTCIFKLKSQTPNTLFSFTREARENLQILIFVLTVAQSPSSYPTSPTAFISGLGDAPNRRYIYIGGGVAGALVLMTVALLFTWRSRYVIACTV